VIRLLGSVTACGDAGPTPTCPSMTGCSARRALIAIERAVLQHWQPPKPQGLSRRRGRPGSARLDAWPGQPRKLLLTTAPLQFHSSSEPRRRMGT